MISFIYIALLLCAVACTEAQTTNLNPCKEQKAVKDKGFVIGLAFVPSVDWINANNTVPESLCSGEAELLVDAQVAAYEMKVDTIAVLQTSRAKEEELFIGANPQVLSVVAFAGNIVSEARYIRSNDPNITGADEESTEGTGILDNLVLIAHFDEGKLQYLRWQEAGCVGCPSERCLHTGRVYAGEKTKACAAASIEECEGSATPSSANGGEPFQCFTNFNVATSGTDEDSQVLRTGTQLQRIRTGSITELYSSTAESVSGAVDSATDAVTFN